MISSLVETIEEIVKVGTHVNFGIVPFSSDSEVAMPLTKIDAENIDELETMLSIQRGLEDISAGRVSTLDEVSAKLKARHEQV